jgi:hypothetical protein
VVDREVVPPPHRSEHRPDNVLGDVLDALTIRAHEVVMVLGIARDVRGYMPVALETTRHPVLDLLLERAIDSGAADRRVCFSNAVVKLLR